MAVTEVKVPDIGDFKEVGVIEILVKPGDVIQVGDTQLRVQMGDFPLNIALARYTDIFICDLA